MNVAPSWYVGTVARPELAWPVRELPESARSERSLDIFQQSEPFGGPLVAMRSGALSLRATRIRSQPGSASGGLLMGSSMGKRQREQQKQERAPAKAQRNVARQTTSATGVDDPWPRSEAELIEELRGLRRTFESGEISPEDFEERRGRTQAQLERLSP